MAVAALMALCLSATVAQADPPRLGVSTVTDPAGGLRIVRVYADSVAAKMRLQVGDVVVEANGSLVNGAYDLRDIVANANYVSLKVVTPDCHPGECILVGGTLAEEEVDAAPSGGAGRTKKYKVTNLKRTKVADPRRRR